MKGETLNTLIGQIISHNAYYNKNTFPLKKGRYISLLDIIIILRTNKQLFINILHKGYSIQMHATTVSQEAKIQVLQ